MATGNNEQQIRSPTETETVAGEGAGKNTSIMGSISNTFSNMLPTGQQTKTQQDKPKEYIEKFKGQTNFIFYEQEEKRGPTFGRQEQPASLKVILRGLYDEYYKKMMYGVLTFTTGEQLNNNVQNMFKRALQALAEKKRIKSAAPPYEFKESKEGSNEVSKSVISQMVVYEKKDGKEIEKRLPILIYDPCIFELENGMKPSIDVENFHNYIQIIFDKVELVGLMDEKMIKGTNVENMGVETNGGGKYVGGGNKSLKEVLNELNSELLTSTRYTPLKKGKKSEQGGQGEIIDYSLTIAAMTERNEIRDFLKQLQFEELKEKHITKLLNRGYGFPADSVKRKDLLKVIIEYYALKTTNYTIDDKEANAVEAATNVKTAEQAAEAAAKTAAKEAAKDAETAAKAGNGIIFNTKDDKDQEKPILFVDFLRDKIPDKLKDGVTKLLKRENVQYEGVRSTTRYESMKKGFAKRINAFGSEKKEEEEKQTAEEAVPDNILLKDMLKYGVWKLRDEEEGEDTLYYMVRPGMLKYLITGENVINPKDGGGQYKYYDNFKETTDGEYDRSGRGMPQNFFGLCFSSINFIGSVWGEGQRHEIGNTEKIEKTIYRQQFQIKECTINEENFKQSDWYKAANARLGYLMGGQSKNTTAKKNKSKRNKSKKNK